MAEMRAQRVRADGRDSDVCLMVSLCLETGAASKHWLLGCTTGQLVICEAIDIAMQYSFAAGLACTRVTTLTQLRFRAIACSCEVQDNLIGKEPAALVFCSCYSFTQSSTPIASCPHISCDKIHLTCQKMVGHIIQTGTHDHGVVLSCMKPI